MGNLLGAPVTDKETHVGSTEEFVYGLSSMQGWRVHMEDAHIAEPTLYALKTKADGTKQKIPLPGHSFFGVFDGHGGTFAAMYTGDNLTRVLSKQPLFVEYALFCQELRNSKKTFSSPAEKVQYMRSGVDFLEGALKQAFVDCDYEIALAIRGTPHPDANKPYTSTVDDSENDDKKAGKDDDDENEDNDPLSDSIMAAAHQAAVDQARALDDEGDSGTTACAVLITPEWLVCANAGDSRSVFSKQTNRAVPLSYDHKPDDEGEERRIRTAGGYVAGGRVEGDLAVSRGLGDFRFKHMPTVLCHYDLSTGKAREESDYIMKPGNQKVSPIPDIILQTRNAVHDEFVIIACDGIWDVCSNQECVVEVASMFKEGEGDIGLVCEEVLDVCLRLGSKDNMTALVIKFKAQSVGKGGGVIARRKERDPGTKDTKDAASHADEEEDGGDSDDGDKAEADHS